MLDDSWKLMVPTPVSSPFVFDGDVSLCMERQEPFVRSRTVLLDSPPPHFFWQHLLTSMVSARDGLGWYGGGGFKS